MNGNTSIDLSTKSIDWSRYFTFVETGFSYCNTFFNKAWNKIDTTVATFFLGFLITEAIRRWNKGRELTQNKYFIEEWVNESNNTLDQYITALKKFAEDISINTDLNIAKWSTPLIHLPQINNISLERFSDIYIWGINNINYNWIIRIVFNIPIINRIPFFKNKKEEYIKNNRIHLMTFLYNVEYIQKATEQVKEQYEKYCRNNELIMNEWNECYLRIVDFLSIPHPLTNETERDIFRDVKQRFLSLITTKDRHFAGTNKWDSDFTTPFMMKLSEPQYQHSEVLYQLSVLIAHLNNVLLKHKKHNQYSEVFNDYVVNLTKAKKDVVTSYDYFHPNSIKFFCE